MSDDIQKETERIHKGIVESLSFSEALANRDAEIARLRKELEGADRVETRLERIEKQQAEIERLRDQDAETLKAHLELAFEVQRLQQAEADELIKKMRSEIDRLRAELTDMTDQRDIFKRTLDKRDYERDELRQLLRETLARISPFTY
jgi:chromosome segregation ATPase